MARSLSSLWAGRMRWSFSDMRRFADERPKQLCRMQGGQAREMFDLFAAGEARRDSHSPLVGLSQRRKQPLFPDRTRDLVMFFLIAERSGHATTARVQVDDFCTGNTAQEPHGRFHARQRALMAVPLDQNSRWP